MLAENASLKCVRHRGYSSDAAVELDNLQIFPSRLPLHSSSESSARRSGGGELQVVHSGFKASSHCSLSDSSPRADDPFQPDNLQPFYAVLMLHMSLSGTLAKVNSFFWLSGPAASLMSRCCVYRHVTLKSWSLETWLHVFSLPFFRNPVICAQFFHT